MPSHDDQKSSTPFKSVDIKTLFLAASSRKRKASSPIPPANEAKSVKICESDDNDIQVIDAVATTDISASDCKENQDLNTLKNEQSSAAGINSTNDNDLKSMQTDGDEQISSDDDLSKASSDDLNSSLLNSSVNALNTSGVSEANVENAEKNKAPEKNEASEKNEAKLESKPEESKEKDNNTNPKKRKRMTPEEAKQKAEEREKKKQEQLLRKKEQEARKLQKEQEKKAREEERKEKERLRLEKKEQEDKEKQQKLEEREAQKRIRQRQIDQKLESKKQKEEERKKAEEERKKAEEEKKRAELEKEQKEKEKKERAKANFFKYFVKENTSPPPPVQKAVEQASIFKPFQISEDMVVAPVIPLAAQEKFNRAALDAALTSQSDENLYLHILKSGCYHHVRQRKRQRQPKLFDADVIIVESDKNRLNLTAKLLQFNENLRPAYWGTWRKKSKCVRPRNPFGQDTIFDYEVDSDEEWDEGGPGESLSGTENEAESDEDDYDVDNEFMVPHGYLSAEEEEKGDEDEDGEEAPVDADPEKQKARLKKKLQEFEMERKKKTTELKPTIWGCYIENDPPSSQSCDLRISLEPYAAVFLIETPILTTFTVKKTKSESKPNSNASSPTQSASASNKKLKQMPDDAMPHLIRLVHGNRHSIAFLIAEFQKFWQKHISDEQSEKVVSEKAETKDEVTSSTNILDSPSPDFVMSKRILVRTLKEIAAKGNVETIKKPVWYVNDEVRAKHGLADLPISNNWTYLTTETKDEEADASPTVKPAHLSMKEFLLAP